MSSDLPTHQPLAAAAAAIELEPIAAEEVVSGSPSAGTAVLGRLAGVEVGIWEMSVGVARDVEVDELFVVVSGRASVEVAGGPTYEIGPGDVVRLPAGDATTWTVHECLRKVYVAAG